jgi:phage tail sheath protein FI
MAIFLHGVATVRKNDGLPMIPDVSQNVAGLLCTADDADPAVIPLNTPVLFLDPTEALASAGTQGTLARSLTAMLNQTRGPVVIVRVAGNTDAAKLEANLVGGNVGGVYTGMKAFLTAKSKFGIAPKIFGAPGLDTSVVTSNFVAIAQSIGGFLYASSRSLTKEQAVAARAGFGARELMLLHGDFVSGSTPVHAVAVAMGLRQKLDAEQSVAKSISIMRITGVDGRQLQTDWDFRNPNTESNYLNEQGLTVLIKNKGYRFWGNRTTSADPEWLFETYTRTDQFLADAMADVMFSFVDRQPTVGLMRDLVLMFDAKLKDLTREGVIVGGSAWFDTVPNNPANLSAGKFFFDYDYTPYSPMEQITLTQRKTQRYWVDLANQVAQLVPSAPAV